MSDVRRLPHPLAGETPELVEAFDALVAAIQAGQFASSAHLMQHLRSEDSTYPARIVYFGAMAWQRAMLAEPYTGEPLQRQEWQVPEPSDGEAVPAESDRIADGVRRIMDERHEGFTTEAKRDADATAAMLKGLVDLPTLAQCGPLADDDGGRMAAVYEQVTGLRAQDGSDYWRLTADQRANYDRQLRRSQRIARAEAATAYLRAALYAVLLTVALVVGWSVLTNGWRWWA